MRAHPEALPGYGSPIQEVKCGDRHGNDQRRLPEELGHPRVIEPGSHQQARDETRLATEVMLAENVDAGDAGNVGQSGDKGHIKWMIGKGQNDVCVRGQTEHEDGGIHSSHRENVIV